jgi:hypothetical protein
MRLHYVFISNQLFRLFSGQKNIQLKLKHFRRNGPTVMYYHFDLRRGQHIDITWPKDLLLIRLGSTWIGSTWLVSTMLVST